MNRVLIFMFFFVCNLCVFAQSGVYNPDVKTPTVAGLGTFGKIPVSKFTGTPDISIDLFQLEGRDFILPTRLRYHPGNLKANQRSGWVGVGWSLPVSVIYREVRGLPDEFEASTGISDRINTIKKGHFMRSLISDVYSNTFGKWFLVGENGKYNQHYEFKWADSEPDVFHFNINGITGCFFLDESKNWRVQSDKNITVELSQAEPLTFVAIARLNMKSTISRCFNKFILKDDEGNRYTFGGPDATEYSVKLIEHNGDSSWDKFMIPEEILNSITASSWFITEMQSANERDIIKFEYSRGPFVSSFDKVASFDQVLKGKFSGSDFNGWDVRASLLSPVYIKKISLRDASIVFNSSRSNEVDYDKDLYAPVNRALSLPSHTIQGLLESIDNQVDEYNGQFSGRFNENALELRSWLIWRKLDSVSLYRGHKRVECYKFTYNNSPSERLFLEAVSHYGEDTGGVQKHTFAYYGKKTMSTYLQTVSDHWGFQNGQEYPTLNSNSDQLYIAREPNVTWLSRGILTEIGYPTGGKARFDFEIGDYSLFVDYYDRKKILRDEGRGGIRIKKIEIFDKDSVMVSRKEYAYKRNGLNNGPLSSGVLNRKPLYALSGEAYDMSNSKFTLKAFRSGSIEDLYDEAGISIGYSEVTERTLMKEATFYHTETYTNHDNGYTDDNPMHRFKADFLLGQPVSSRAFERGRVLTQTYFDSEKNKVRSVRNFWKNHLEERFQARSLRFNFRGFTFGRSIPPNPDNPGHQNPNPLPQLDDYSPTNEYYPSVVAYYNYYHPVFLQKTADTVFTSNGYKANEVVYEHNLDDKLIKNKKYLTAKGAVVEVHYTYPNNYKNQSGFVESSYEKMMFFNLNSFPVEIIKKENDKIVEGKVYDYIVRNGAILAAKEYKLSVSKPINDYQPSYLQDGKLTKDSRFILENEITKNDTYGNPLEVKNPGGMLKSFVWSNNGKWPLLVAANVSYDLLSNSLGGEEEVKRLSSPNVSDVDIQSKSVLLRQKVPQAQISSYTYDDIYGITSFADARGATQYYDYDFLGRLKTVKDNSQSIVRSIDYNVLGYSKIIGSSYVNRQMYGNFRKQCGGLGGSTVEYVVPSGKYTSTDSQEEADDLAKKDIEANGQLYANEHGSCLESISVENQVREGRIVRVTFIGETGEYVFNSQNDGSFSGIGVPAGTYKIDVDCEGFRDEPRFVNFRNFLEEGEGCKEFRRGGHVILPKIEVFRGRRHLISISNHCVAGGY